MCCLTRFILFNEYIWIYSLESKNLNESLNIFKRKKSIKWMTEYICFKKIHEYLSEWIYSSINIWIYSNIRIFSTHWYRTHSGVNINPSWCCDMQHTIWTQWEKCFPCCINFWGHLPTTIRRMDQQKTAVITNVNIQPTLV